MLTRIAHTLLAAFCWLWSSVLIYWGALHTLSPFRHMRGDRLFYSVFYLLMPRSWDGPLFHQVAHPATLLAGLVVISASIALVLMTALRGPAMTWWRRSLLIAIGLLAPAFIVCANQ